MQRTAEQSARDVDLILFVMDAHAGIREEDFAAAKRFMRAKIPFVLVLWAFRSSSHLRRSTSCPRNGCRKHCFNAANWA